MEIGETLYVVTRQEWRKWLGKHHKDKAEIWLVFYKKASGKPGIAYEDAVAEAICYGWVDSQERSIDAEKYALRFTPRRKDSNWVESNRVRALKMIRAGKMTKAGLAVLPPELIKPGNRYKRRREGDEAMVTFKFSPNLALQTPEQNQAVEFYQKVFGLEVAGRENNSIALKAGNFWIWLDQGEFLGPVFEFIVANLEAGKEKLLAAGCQVLRREGRKNPCYMRDPFRFVFSLWEEPGAFSSSAD